MVRVSILSPGQSAVSQEYCLVDKDLDSEDEVIAGPKMMAPMPVPAGWVQLPVTEGSFREERTKTKAPATARRGRVSRWSLIIRFILETP